MRYNQRGLNVQYVYKSVSILIYINIKIKKYKYILYIKKCKAFTSVKNFLCM